MLTPHFAPETCGVSDYTACWKARLEGTAEVFLVALADKYHPGILQRKGLLRMGAELPLAERLSLLRQVLEQQHFDAIVFHYVPHGYLANGLPWWLLRLARLLKEQAIPITMVAHEIWMGGAGKPLRVRLRGFLQKILFLRIERLLFNPNIITTSSFTAHQLHRNGLVADWCPVFNNLETDVSSGSIPPSVAAILQAGANTPVLMFGSIPPDTPISAITGFLKLLWFQYQKPVLLLHAGYADVQPLEKIRKASSGFNLSVEVLGPLPAHTINALMQQCKWGMSTYPIQLWSKSGSIAAMLANGLPVAVLGSLKNEALPPPENLPNSILPWIMLTAPEREAFIKDYRRSTPILKDYNQHIANRLHALSGIGGEEINAFEVKPSLTVLITVYRCWPQAAECIRHLKVFAGINGQTEILLVNDDPGSPVPEFMVNAPGVTIINNPVNMGYVASVNRGVALAKGETILLLDADAYIQTPVEAALMLIAKDPEARLLVPVCHLADGTLVRRLYPQPHIVSMLFGQQFEKWWVQKLRSPQMVSHSYAWIFRRVDFLSIGGFDEQLYFLEADVEFCMRLQKAFPGGSRMCGSVQVIHEGGANPIRRNQRVAEWYRSRWYILNKHNAIPFRPLCKGLITIRLQLEKGLAAIFTLTQPGQNSFWRQKSEGRKMLLKDLKNW